MQFCSLWCVGRKIEFQETVKKCYFVKQFLRPYQSGAHGNCHACLTLDTPLPHAMAVASGGPVVPGPHI